MKDIITKGRIKTRLELEEIKGWKISEWNLYQLRHLVNTLPHPLREEEKLSPLEKLCFTRTPLKNGISKIYGILTDLDGQGRPEYIEQWEKELDSKLEDQKVEKMMGMGYNNAWDMNTIEMSYKFLARWYLTPVRTHRYQQEKTSLCWRNCNQRATMTHIW